MSCTTCSTCAVCSASAAARSPTAATPFSTRNLIPAGTFRLTLHLDQRPDGICDHTHEEDGWHIMSSRTMSCFCSRSSFLLELEFLIQKHFVVVTYQLEPEFEVTARVYLVPYDLSNVKGSLRKRPTTVLNPARRYLKALIPKLSLNPVHWNSGCTDEAMRPFHEPSVWCSSIRRSHY